jgi:hypothetical protein
MKGWQRAVVGLLSLLLVVPAGVARADDAVVVLLNPLGGSEVRGRASLLAEGAATRVTLEVAGLSAGQGYMARLHGGTCEQPGASFAELSALIPDGSGEAKAAGSVRFRDTEDVALATVADGEHVILVSGPNGSLACGVIAATEAAGRHGPATLPETGADPRGTPPYVASLVGILALAGGLLARSGRRAAHGTIGSH